MRAMILAAVAAIGASTIAPPALAQGLHADGLKRLPGVDPVETSPIQRLPDEARDWIAEEQARQKANPADPLELAVEIERNIGPALNRAAKRERLGSGDLFLVVMYDIVAGADAAAAEDLERLRASGAGQAELEAAAAAKSILARNLGEVVKSQTVVSRSLIPDLAWSER